MRVDLANSWSGHVLREGVSACRAGGSRVLSDCGLVGWCHCIWGWAGSRGVRCSTPALLAKCRYCPSVGGTPPSPHTIPDTPGVAGCWQERSQLFRHRSCRGAVRTVVGVPTAGLLGHVHCVCLFTDRVGGQELLEVISRA